MVGGGSVDLSGENEKAVIGWDLVGRKLDFSQIHDVAEYLQVADIELFIDSLVILKKYNDDHNNANQHNG